MLVCYYVTLSLSLSLSLSPWTTSLPELSVYSPLSTTSTSSVEGESPLLSPAIDTWLATFSNWPADYRTQALNRLIKQ